MERAGMTGRSGVLGCWGHDCEMDFETGAGIHGFIQCVQCDLILMSSVIRLAALVLFVPCVFTLCIVCVVFAVALRCCGT